MRRGLAALTRGLGRIAMLAFPRGFRRRYGDEMLEVLTDRVKAMGQTGGRWGVCRLLFRTVRDMLSNGLAERWSRQRVGLRGGRPARGRMPGVTDVRQVLRGLTRRPGYAMVTVLTLAIGIGASSAMFSLVDQILLRPLPFPEPERLVALYDTNLDRGITATSSSPANFVDWRRELTGAFTALAASNATRLTYSDVDPAESLPALAVSAGWFEMLGVRPALGRTFAGAEEVAGNDRVVVVSHGFWASRLGADSAVVGRTLSFEGEPYTVIGIAPRGFAFPDPAIDLWVPLSFAFDVSTSRGVHYITVLGRLAPGVGMTAASSRAEAVMARLRARYPEQLSGWGVRLESLHASIVGETEPRLLLFLGAVGLLLVVAFVNVANLFLAQAPTRARELAVRAAMGAGRARLGRQLVVEGLVVALVAGVVALPLAWAVTRGVVGFAPANIPRLSGLGLDARGFGFATGLTLLLGVSLGAVSALRLARSNLALTLRAGAAEVGAGRGPGRLRGAFVVAQVALALVLGVTAGLLTRSLGKLIDVDPGYGADRGLVATVALPRGRYPDDAGRQRLFSALADRAGRLPGVESAAVATQLPLEGYGINFSFRLAGTDPPIAERPGGDFRVISPTYFTTMEIPVVRGRVFTTATTAFSEPVIVINETLAAMYFSDRDPIGQALHVSYGGEEIARRIIGVVGDVRQRTLAEHPAPAYYLPLAQVSWNSMRVVLRSSVEPMSLLEPLRREVAALDPLLAVRSAGTLEDRLTAATGSTRFNALLLGAFASVTLILAIAGIYGVMSYLVSQRSHEIGVRLALGEPPAAVRRAVSLTGLRLALGGVGLGVVGALLLARGLDALLFGVSASDPVTFAAAAAAFTTAAWAGAYVPARRASSVDPLIVLRTE